MDCIAHRGFAGDHAENTVDALAAADVADWVEFDVRRCGSGEIVVIHDATVDRVTDGTGRVAELTREELAALDVLGSGTGVPTLERVLDAVPPSTAVNVELKERGLASDVASRLGEREHRVIVSAFDDGALTEMARTADYPLAYLCSDDVDGGIERALDIGCQAIHPNWRLCDEAVVERAHDVGLTVNVWTVRDAAAASAAKSANADGIIADSVRFCGP